MPKVQQAATSWLAWYDSMFSEPGGTDDDAWNPPRLEYALSVGRAAVGERRRRDDLLGVEIDGPIDWSSFDVNTQASLTTAADQGFTSIVEATIPAPVTSRASRRRGSGRWRMRASHTGWCPSGRPISRSC